MMRELRVLHLTPDDKFFDDVYNCWLQLDGVANEAIVITKEKDHQLKYIKRTDNLTVLSTRKQVGKVLSKGGYDLLFLYSLHPQLYYILNFIPKDKIVIWWMWGFDVYFDYMKLPPVIPLNLYKPITLSYQKAKESIKHDFLSYFYHLFDNIRLKCQRKSALDRIDYFQPVLKTEFDELRRLYKIRAKEFYYPDSWNINASFQGVKTKSGNILLGNSATSSNNHLDVLGIIEGYCHHNQRIIMPLNYGEEKYKDWLTNAVERKDNIQVISDFMPKDDYFNLVDNCSYACFGVIRQQAMANILYAIMTGIKVFLYKDSIPYKDLKKLGFVVYALEDVDKDSFNTPITHEEMEQNIRANAMEIERRNTVFLQCIDEIRYRC